MLIEVSSKAQERIQVKQNEGYPLLTPECRGCRGAGRRQPIKATPRPR